MMFKNVKSLGLKQVQSNSKPSLEWDKEWGKQKTVLSVSQSRLMLVNSCTKQTRHHKTWTKVGLN